MDHSFRGNHFRSMLCNRICYEQGVRFSKIREALSERQRSGLDAYIAACEELEHALIPISYCLEAEEQTQ